MASAKSIAKKAPLGTVRKVDKDGKTTKRVKVNKKRSGEPDPQLGSARLIRRLMEDAGCSEHSLAKETVKATKRIATGLLHVMINIINRVHGSITCTTSIVTAADVVSAAKIYLSHFDSDNEHVSNVHGNIADCIDQLIRELPRVPRRTKTPVTGEEQPAAEEEEGDDDEAIDAAQQQAEEQSDDDDDNGTRK